MVIFVDTSALLALINVNDTFHDQAIGQWRALLRGKDTLFTNNYVILESISLIQRRFGMDRIDSLNKEVLSLMDVAWVDENQHQAAWDTFVKANRRRLSLVDCSSFESMRSLGIEKVFTSDEHFQAQGFQIIP
jgi:predicted nucleic acid-binding protein